MPATAAHSMVESILTIVLIAASLLLALVYLRGWRILRHRLPGRIPPWRLVAFLAGMALVWIAWSAQLDALTHLLLTAHMAQHLLLMLFAPPLLLFGSPVLVLARGISTEPQDAEQLMRIPGPPWSRAAGNWLTHPVVAGSLMVGTTIAWHIPPIFELAMRSMFWHNFENAMFLATGVLFWWPVILPWPGTQRWPRWTVPLYLLGADLPVSVLSAYLAFCGYVVYPTYGVLSEPYGISALNDQVAAAMIMWVAMLVVFLTAAAFVIVDLLDPQLRRGPEAGVPAQPVARSGRDA